MTDWKAIARARGLAIPEADVEKIAPRLDALEAAFRPLAVKLTPDQEPAVVFHADPESE
ncbi:MAG TPA: hypothetical protein VGF16_02255 [Bryobacteraceae bacterium]|jgi:hypothetical protein